MYYTFLNSKATGVTTLLPFFIVLSLFILVRGGDFQYADWNGQVV